MRIKDWQKFQHFKDRKPIWIKLYRDILDDPEWSALDGDSSKVLVMLWLLASEYDGYLPDIKTISFRLRTTEKKIIEHISKLNHWVIIDDIKSISSCHQNDIPEKRRDREETDYRAGFGIFYQAYPKKVAPKDAEKSYKKALESTTHEQIMAGLERYKQSVVNTERRYIQAPAAWLNKGRWADDYGSSQASVPDWIRAQR